MEFILSHWIATVILIFIIGVILIINKTNRND